MLPSITAASPTANHAILRRVGTSPGNARIVTIPVVGGMLPSITAPSPTANPAILRRAVTSRDNVQPVTTHKIGVMRISITMASPIVNHAIPLPVAIILVSARIAIAQTAGVALLSTIVV